MIVFSIEVRYEAYQLDYLARKKKKLFFKFNKPVIYNR